MGETLKHHSFPEVMHSAGELLDYTTVVMIKIINGAYDMYKFLFYFPIKLPTCLRSTHFLCIRLPFYLLIHLTQPGLFCSLFVRMFVGFLCFCFYSFLNVAPVPFSSLLNTTNLYLQTNLLSEW